MIDYIIDALNSKNFREGTIESARLGLTTGFIAAILDPFYGDISLATSEAISTLLPTTGSLILRRFSNDADKNEYWTGVLSANIFHRIAYYSTKGVFALMQNSQL